MYAQDSFFTLSPAGQAGLAAVSLGLAGLAVWGAFVFARRQRWPLRLAVALIVFWNFLWLSPQIYYIYYWLIIEGLPLQWVLGAPPSPATILRLLTFGADATLSAHGQGVLGWALILVCGAGNAAFRRDAAN